MIEETKDGIFFKIRASPKAGATEICEWQDNILRVRVHALPEKGKANLAIIAYFAKLLGVPKSAVTIKGTASRNKKIFIEGISKERAEQLIAKMILQK